MPRDPHKNNILLDLDQTLISAEPNEDFNYNKYKKKIDALKSKFKGQVVEYDMDGYYTVFSRPYLQEFLDYLFKNFNVSICTAATKDYALFIIKNIILNNKPDRKLDFIFFSYHCEWSKKEYKCSKKLCMIWDKHKIDGYSPNNTVIIDDFKEDVHKCQPNNCIIAPPYEIKKKDSENDTFLRDLIPKLENLNKRMNNKDTALATVVNSEMNIF
jgi:hypothetical protein